MKVVQVDEKIWKVSEVFNISSNTLQKKIYESNLYDPQLWMNSAFTLEYAENITEHVTFLAELFHGLNPVQVCHIALTWQEMFNHT